MSEVVAIPLGAIRPVNSPFRAGLDTQGGFTQTTAASTLAPRDDYARGYIDGAAEAEARAAQDNRAGDLIQQAITQLRAEPSEELGLYIAEAVSHLVRQIVGETQITPEEITRRAQAAAALIAENDAATAIRLHPEDAALVGSSIGAVSVVPEPGLLRGDVLVECAAGTIEDGNALRLAALDAALGLGDHE
jgi:flagellar biosynthesis/type III secretory pathway protein FliH